MKTYTLILATLAAALLLVPGAAAHPKATPIDNPVTGVRCYVFDNDGDVTLWQETNGMLAGGEESRLGGDSGLQREAFEDESGRTVPADTQLDATHWAEHCSAFDH